jgi:hypothetical protein
MCGDGGFATLMQEFFTSVQHGLPVKVFVFNNGGWGLVHLEMEGAGLAVFSGAKTGNPNFAMFAQSCGAQGYRVTEPRLLRETIATALARPARWWWTCWLIRPRFRRCRMSRWNRYGNSASEKYANWSASEDLVAAAAGRGLLVELRLRAGQAVAGGPGTRADCS